MIRYIEIIDNINNNRNNGLDFHGTQSTLQKLLFIDITFTLAVLVSYCMSAAPGQTEKSTAANVHQTATNHSYTFT